MERHVENACRGSTAIVCQAGVLTTTHGLKAGDSVMLKAASAAAEKEVPA